MNDVTRLLNAIQQGDRQAAEELLPVVYNELRHLAAGMIANENRPISMQGTELVHAAYIRLVDTSRVQSWDSINHFFSAAAEAMRRILVERARERQCLKRQGNRQRLELTDSELMSWERSNELLSLDDALNELKTHDHQSYQLVMLRYFAGMGHQEAAAVLGISRRVADRLWAVAKVWLFEHIADSHTQE
jgi:RNA polymerase sigma factor (TIGR02999 family)